MNLVINSRDAMPMGGQLSIETGNVELDHHYIRQHADIQPGHYVMLAISDTGCGIDKALMPKIFEPFFTTKKKGKGTGLGLSTVYGIVKQSGGNIFVYSEVDKGTTFKMYFPRIDEREKEEEESVVLMEATPMTGTILLVEDEDSVRSIVKKILIDAGFQVLEASQFEEALQISHQHTEPIHLLITDVIMPGKSGKELADHLGKLRPEMKVLFVSGYTDNAIVHHGVLEKGLEFLQKPFTPTALLHKIRMILESARKT